MKKKDKQSPLIGNPIRKFYPTSDDWSPNFPRNTVEIAVYTYHNPDKIGSIPDGMIRICVRGADDTGMERDERLSISEYPKRLIEIDKWLTNNLPNPLTMEWLRGQGFKMW